MGHYIGQLGLPLLYMPTLQHQSVINQAINQSISQSISSINHSINMHMPTLQCARAHLAVCTRPPCNMHTNHAICTCAPCSVHLPTLQHASAHLVMCTRSPCSMQAPAGRVSSLCRSHFCLHDHAVTDQHTQPTLLMLAKTQTKLYHSYI